MAWSPFNAMFDLKKRQHIIQFGGKGRALGTSDWRIFGRYPCFAARVVGYLVRETGQYTLCPYDN